jgi:hypothetical protein
LNNDEIGFDMVKRWITTGKTDHGKKCSRHDKAHVPARRLIDVHRSCLVDGSMAKEYMTLSYVWGMAAQFMLTTDVLTDSLKPGFFESLGTNIPQSIQDAIQVCRNIGVRHIWVDALCILQDDDIDKKDQIALMDEIYGRALAVLIVAAGDGAAYGIPGLGKRKRELASYVETVDGQELMTSLATTTFSAKRSQWNTRAWTYQEYILGNRLLVFTDTYVFFKCSQSMFRDDAWKSVLSDLKERYLPEADEIRPTRVFLQAVESIQPVFTQHWTNTIESTAVMHPIEGLKEKIPDGFKIAQIFRNQIKINRDATAAFSTAILQGKEAPSQGKTTEKQMCFEGYGKHPLDRCFYLNKDRRPDGWTMRIGAVKQLLEGLKKSLDLQERHQDAIKEMEEFLDESKKRDALGAQSESQSKPIVIGSA